MGKCKLLLTCIIFFTGLSAYASGQFLKVDGQIINRMSIVSVGKVEKPCVHCICSYLNCDKWHFCVYPTTNFSNPIVIAGSDFKDIQNKHKTIENWLILGK